LRTLIRVSDTTEQHGGCGDVVVPVWSVTIIRVRARELGIQMVVQPSVDISVYERRN
jgi:hypothetical protein